MNAELSVQEKYDGEVPGIYVFDSKLKTTSYVVQEDLLPRIEVQVMEAVAEMKASPSVAIYPDAAFTDTWTGNEYGTVEVTDEGLYLKSTKGDNGKQQFYVENDKAVISKDEAGFVEFTVRFISSLGDTRFGVYLFSGGPMLGQFVGYDTGSKWFWQSYTTGNPPYGPLNFSNIAEESHVRIDYGEGKARVTINGVTSGTEVDLSRIAEGDTKLAFKAAQWGTTSTEVLIKDIHYTGQEVFTGYNVSGTVKDEFGKTVNGALLKTEEGMSAVTDKDGNFTGLYMSEGTHTVTISAAGYVTGTETYDMAGEEVEGAEFILKSAPVIEIESGTMKVQLYENYPAVRQYTLKGGDLDGKVVGGSLEAPNAITINGKDVILTEDSVQCTAEGNKAVYQVTIPGTETMAACTITVELTADDEGNILTMEIPSVEYKDARTAENAIQSIRFPNQSLVSVSSEDNGTFAGGSTSSHTAISGDTFADVKDMEAGNKEYLYAFVSDGTVSAAIESNSEANGSVTYANISGGSQNTRLVATTREMGNGVKVTGLGSNVFYWNRVEWAKEGNAEPGSGIPSGKISYITEPTETPLVKIIITGDQNGDEKTDWQDGAIAFREISHEIFKSSEVPDVVAMRIVENFSSQATNPFLLTLDNAKKIYLNTDGLGQAILLKGYANEGHDSGHPDYYDINKRAGGVEDFKEMLAGGSEIGAKFGIHVNASEMYPESDAFDEDLIYWKEDGSLRYGWNWLDQGIGIDSRFDLVSGRREARFDKLHEALGGDGEDQLNFIYVDVWGNATSTLEDSWATRRLTDEITGNGWRMATEWGIGNEYDSTFQHWSNDLTYGGQDSKGFNSRIMRFIRNGQKDAWVGDYPTYGGEANAPLLGGYNQKDFEGWSGRNNYNSYITNLFTHNISDKFLQHFEVTQWEQDPENPAQVTDKKSGKKLTWIPDKFMTLQGEYGNIRIERESTDYSTAVDAPYRNRTITLNDKVILTGHASKTDTGEQGDEMYLIPWYWDANGEKLGDEDQKLYHWNTKGGTSTWELPDDWSDLSSVYMYELTDQGKANMIEVAVNQGEVTLEAEEETPYVVYQGEAAPLEVTWESKHLVDTGFNSGNLDAWTVKGDAGIYETTYGNPVICMNGGSSMSQTITDLVPGTQYALYLALDNRSDADFIMKVTGRDGSALGSNRAGKSIAKNYVATDPHNSNYGMEAGSTGYTQNMYVFFTADSETAVLTLSRVAGEGATYFDNLRVVENDSENIQYSETGEIVGYTQDFENVVQGLYPFVMGSATGTADNRVHLSELHDPYTQGGWDVKKGSDVLDGNWSVKANGQVQKNSVVFQTVPHNIYFEPGYTYHVSFDYQTGSENTYGVVIGDGEEFSSADVKLLPYAENEDGTLKTQTFEFDIRGAADGLTWFGLYSTGSSPDVHGLTGSAADFSGYKDLVVDNLSVVRTDSEPQTGEELQALIDEASAKYHQNDYSSELWAKYRMALAQAKAVLAKDVPATDREITSAYNLLKSYMEVLDAYEGLPADSAGMDIAATMTATAKSWQDPDVPQNAVDGDEETQWHTSWSQRVIGDETSDFIEIELSEASDIDGVRYLPRASGINGIILEMKVLVSGDGENWTTVPAGDGSETFKFEGNTSWKKASFEKQKGVKFVRLVAVHTMGNGDEADKYISAREFRLTNSELYIPEALPVDTGVLQYVVGQTEGLTERYYTPETWSVLTAKLSAARTAMESNDYDQTALALANLNDAITALVPVPVAEAGDKKELQSLVDEYSKLTQDSYTEASWDELEKAIAEAQKVLDDDGATVAEVEKALIKLNTAKANLVEKPVEPEDPEVPDTVDKTDLKSLVDRCGEIEKGSYTDSSWNTFQEALDAARKVIADEKATAADVEQAVKALKAAEENLTKKSDGSSGGSSGSSSSSGSSASRQTVSYPVLTGNYPSAEASGEWEQTSPGNWKLKKADGAYARNEWLKVNGAWYLFGDNSTMMTNWVQVNGVWYYLDPVNGDMKTGWQLVGGVWYYLEPSSGAMRTGWVLDGGKWYYLDASGKMLSSTTTPDGYNVDGSGAWVQ